MGEGQHNAPNPFVEDHLCELKKTSKLCSLPRL